MQFEQPLSDVLLVDDKQSNTRWYKGSSKWASCGRLLYPTLSLNLYSKMLPDFLEGNLKVPPLDIQTYFFFRRNCEICTHWRHKIVPTSSVRALAQTGREKSIANGAIIDRIAGDRDGIMS